MKNNLKILGVGAVAALGLASAAVAQQSDANKPPMTAEQHQQMMSGGGTMGHGQMMMNDPKMRQQMTEMMDNCNKMMKQMGSMQGMQQNPKR